MNITNISLEVIEVGLSHMQLYSEFTAYTERNISAEHALKLFTASFIVVIACTTPQIVVRPALISIKLKIHQISVC